MPSNLPTLVAQSMEFAHAARFVALAAIGGPPTSRAWAIVLGVVFAIVAISLLVASWTRWGQSKPLAKCVGIAIVAHIWLLLYAYGTRIVSPGFGPGADGGIATSTSMPAVVAWVSADNDSFGPEAPLSDASTADTLSDASEPRLAQPWEMPMASPTLEQVDAPKLPEPSFETPSEIHIESRANDTTMDTELGQPSEYSAEELMRLAELPIDPSLPAEDRTRSIDDSSIKPAMVPPSTSARSLAGVPREYHMRLSPNRLAFAAANGGDANTETAVQNALMWLAREQSSDGSWSAAQHGAGEGRPTRRDGEEGRYRANAGARADTAMSGLALLSFLGSGHTHREGPYAETIARGLRYLIAQQLPSGDLSGRDQIGQDPTVRYARMYSHGMASLAMAEAYALTQDAELLAPLQSAVGYTIKAMNPRTGGWRYDFASDDPGDTSQFGWQAMLLHSASSSRAIRLSGSSRIAMQRFLDSVSTGRAGGLAVYRNVAPGVRAPTSAATPAMTAEAMAMRCLLELPISNQAASEARSMLIDNLPGQGDVNFYYWYYGALAMYQMRGSNDQAAGLVNVGMATPSEAAWTRWNDAMKTQLCGRQIVHGPNAGSWDPTDVWGTYGGRVYSTATACMCLEVYYRYLPLYQSLNLGDR